MARYDFTNDGGVLKIVLENVPAIYEKQQSMSLAVPSITLAVDIIKLYDSGLYFNSYVFNDIGLIAGVQPADINAAFEALTDLVATILSGGGGGGGGVTTDTIQSITARKDFTVGAGPAATFTATTGNAVNVTATTGSGLYSTSVDGPGVEGFSVNDPGIFGYSSNEPGVFSHSQNSTGFIVDSLNAGNLNDLAHFRANGTPVVKITKSGRVEANQLNTIGTVNAAAALARGGYLNNTLVATANNDVLVGLDINPAFNNGAFTGVINLAIRSNENIGLLNGKFLKGFHSGLYHDLIGINSGGNVQISTSDKNSVINGSNIIFNTAGVKGTLFNTGNWVFQNGGTFTDNGFRLDVQGTARVTGLLTTAASTTLEAAMRLTIGVAPTTPADGDLWLESNTLTGLKIRLGGVTRTVTLT
jgi:hypothetical protein